MEIKMKNKRKFIPVLIVAGAAVVVILSFGVVQKFKRDYIDETLDKLQGPDYHCVSEARDKLINLGSAATLGILEIFQDAPNPLKYQLIYVLGSIKDRRAVDIITNEKLQNENPYIRIMAVNALAEIGGGKALDAISDTLRNDRADIVKAAAARAFPKFSNPPIEPLLEVLIQYRDKIEEQVKLYIIKSLEKIKDKSAAQVLLDCLNYHIIPSQMYKNEVVCVLGNLGDTSALEDLRRYRDDLKSKPIAMDNPREIFQREQALKIVNDAIRKIEAVVVEDEVETDVTIEPIIKKDILKIKSKKPDLIKTDKKRSIEKGRERK